MHAHQFVTQASRMFRRLRCPRNLLESEDDSGGANGGLCTRGATSDGCVDDAAVRWIACNDDWTGNVVVYHEDAVNQENAVKV